MQPLPVSPGASYQGYLNNIAYHEACSLPTIIPRDASGKLGSQYSAADPVGNNVTRAVNICRYMMTHPKVREAFVKIAQKYAAARPNVWYRHQQPPVTTVQITHTFLMRVMETFPRIFIDYALKNPDYGAHHSRHRWGPNFEPEHQAISINGMNAVYMATACSKAENSARDQDLYLYQRCLFMTANNLFHEMGHVFVAWLSEGQADAPPLINALALGPLGEDIGEAGRALEQYIFGGQVLYCRDPIWKEGDRCGPAYLRKPSGANHRILPQVIKGVISYNFAFPYGHEENPEPEGTLRMLGDGMPADTFTDPWASSGMADYP